MIEHYEGDGEGKVTGRVALLNLIKKCSQKEDYIFRKFFCFHLIVSRKLILKRCLQNYLKETKHYKEIITYLDKCIEKWCIIKDLSFDYLYYGHPIGMKGKPVLESIVEYECHSADYLEPFSSLYLMVLLGSDSVMARLNGGYPAK